jgi:hypothetical protein
MSWPLEHAYQERDSGRRRQDLPFIIEAKSARLKIALDSECVLEPEEERYFTELSLNADGLNVEMVEIDTTNDSSIQDGVWTVDLSNEGPSGEYGVKFADQSGRLTWASTAFHVGDFAQKLSERDSLDFPVALKRHARYEAAEAIDVDIYVSSGAPIFNYGVHGSMIACTPRDALSVAGLYQRLHGNLLVCAKIPIVFGVDWAHFIMAQGLLPELAGMFPRLNTPRPWDHTASLLLSARTRLERVLDDRDTIILRHLLSGRRTMRPAAEVALERVALNLVGSFDALARAINDALDLGIEGKHCSFSKERFVRKTGQSVREAVKLARVIPLLEITNLLRNTIHHESLGSGAYSGPSRTLEPLAGIPSADGSEFMLALQKFPELSNTTLDRAFGEDVYIRVLPFTEALMPLALGAIRSILSACPWPGDQNQDRHLYDDAELHNQLRLLYAL